MGRSYAFSSAGGMLAGRQRVMMADFGIGDIDGNLMHKTDSIHVFATVAKPVPGLSLP